MTLLLNVDACAPTARSVPPDAVAFARVEEAVNVAGIAGLELFPWQEEILRSSLMVRAGDPSRWAAREVGISVSRQAGKGSILEARQLAGLFVIGERLQVHSAHEFKTCYEHFRRVVGLIEGCDVLMRQVKIIRTGAGDQAVELTNGNRLRFIARSRSSGRGFSADAVYLDEAFELSTETMGALLPALSARPNPQVWYTSSAAHRDSVVLHAVRKRGLADEDPRLFYVEWANDTDVDPTDPESWRRANPSLGLLVSEDDIAAEQRSLDPAEFARERLGIPEEPEGAGSGPVDVELWKSLTDGESLPADGTERLALDVSNDRRFSTIGIAGRRSDGLGHVSIRHREPGTSWVVARAKELTAGHGCPLIVAAGSPGASMVGDLELAGVPLDVMSTADYAAACQRFVDGVNAAEPVVRHRGSPDHLAAVVAARIKPAGDGGFVLSRRSASSDITPLTTAVMAWGRVGHGEPTRSKVMHTRSGRIR